MDWQTSDGKDHHVTFSGIPDGRRIPFNGGELADEMAINAVSKRELNSYAYKDGKELMVAQRQLDDTGAAMRVTQVVKLAGGEIRANVAIYQKRLLN